MAARLTQRQPSLDTPESPRPPIASDPAGATLVRALLMAGASLNRIDRVAHCGESFWVYRHKVNRNRYRIARDLCHDRFCPRCSILRARTIRSALSSYTRGRTIRFLTLTLRSTLSSLTQNVNRLGKCFTRLRRTPLWRSHVRGGAAFYEITRNPQSGLWHAHIHALIEGSFIAQNALATEWEHITGDSRIVDIRYVNSHAAVSNYVTKYVTKPVTDPLNDDLDTLAAAIQALRHRKLCTTFGQWRHLRLTTPPQPSEWERLVHWNELRLDDPEQPRWHPLLKEAVRLAIAGLGPDEFELQDQRPPPASTP